LIKCLLKEFLGFSLLVSLRGLFTPPGLEQGERLVHIDIGQHELACFF